MKKYVKSIHSYDNINGIIPGVKGQRAFPTNEFNFSDPLLMLDHIGPERVGKDWFLDGRGHDHPHKGFETLTFMFEGKMEHRDSIGNKATLTSGSVQRMNAGSGIIHGGDMSSDPETKRFHELQLWINNPSSEKLSQPEIHNLTDDQIPKIQEGNLTLKLISGFLNRLEGKIRTKANTQIAHLIAKGVGEIIVGDFPKENKVMIYVLEGNILIEDTVIREFQLAVLSEEGNTIRVKTQHPAQLLILSGEPLNESVAFGGPFVMNTKEEINQAYVDFQNGLFGEIEY